MLSFDRVGIASTFKRLIEDERSSRDSGARLTTLNEWRRGVWRGGLLHLVFVDRIMVDDESKIRVRVRLAACDTDCDWSSLHASCLRLGGLLQLGSVDRVRADKEY
jgi:hypothetical protein